MESKKLNKRIILTVCGLVVIIVFVILALTAHDNGQRKKSAMVQEFIQILSEPDKDILWNNQEYSVTGYDSETEVSELDAGYHRTLGHNYPIARLNGKLYEFNNDPDFTGFYYRKLSDNADNLTKSGSYYVSIRPCDFDAELIKCDSSGSYFKADLPWDSQGRDDFIKKDAFLGFALIGEKEYIMYRVLMIDKHGHEVMLDCCGEGSFRELQRETVFLCSNCFVSYSDFTREKHQSFSGYFSDNIYAEIVNGNERAVFKYDRTYDIYNGDKLIQSFTISEEQWELLAAIADLDELAVIDTLFDNNSVDAELNGFILYGKGDCPIHYVLQKGDVYGRLQKIQERLYFLFGLTFITA